MLKLRTLFARQAAFVKYRGLINHNYPKLKVVGSDGSFFLMTRIVDQLAALITNMHREYCDRLAQRAKKDLSVAHVDGRTAYCRARG